MTAPDPLLPGSLRGRLTLWLAVIVGLVLIALVVSVYALLARGLFEETRQALRVRATHAQQLLRRNPRILRGQGVVVPRRPVFSSPEVYVQLRRPDGSTIARSANLGGASLPLPPGAYRAAMNGRARFDTTEISGERVELYTDPVIRGGRVVAILQVAGSAGERELRTVRVLFGAGLVISLLLVAAIIWLTAGAALRPLRRLTETAEAVGSSQDLSRRVGVPPSDDEVGQLARTFNRMLERLEASNEELRRAHARLENALQAQRRFVADASHELRTPLTTIRGNANLLQQFPNVTPEDRAAAVEQIGQEAERMSRLVEDLLALARSDAGREPRRDRVPLGPLVREMVERARGLARGQQVSAQQVQEVTVLGDPDELRRVVLILLDNAIKYTPSGGRVDVALRREGDEAVLSVSDTGIGINPEDLPHVFERFYRADPARQPSGAGLGLSIALEIARRHGGTIEARSRPGEGSVFTARLPAAP